MELTTIDNDTHESVGLQPPTIDDGTDNVFFSDEKFDDRPPSRRSPPRNLNSHRNRETHKHSSHHRPRHSRQPPPPLPAPKLKRSSPPPPKQQEAEVEPEDFDLLINPEKCKTGEAEVAQLDREYMSQAKTAQPSQAWSPKQKKGGKSKMPVLRPPSPGTQPKEDDEGDYDDDGGEDGYDDDGEGEYDDEDYGDEEEEDEELEDPKPGLANASRQIQPVLSVQDIALQKAKVLFRLKRRSEFMKIKIEYNTNMSLEQLETIDAQYKHEANATSTVDMMRQILIYVAGITEAMSKSMKFMGMNLDGFNSYMYLRIKKYDEVFFDVYDEYCNTMQFSPLWRLLYMYVMDTVSYSSAQALMANPEMANNIANMTKAWAVPNTQPPAKTTTPAPTAFVPGPDLGTIDEEPEPDANAESEHLLQMLREEEERERSEAGKTQAPIEAPLPPDTMSVSVSSSSKKRGAAKSVIRVV